MDDAVERGQQADSRGSWKAEFVGLVLNQTGTSKSYPKLKKKKNIYIYTYIRTYMHTRIPSHTSQIVISGAGT